MVALLLGVVLLVCYRNIIEDLKLNIANYLLQIGIADWVCHIGTLTPCIEAVA